MRYIRYPGLTKISKDIWETGVVWNAKFCIFSSYIKSKDNKDADRESRIKNINTECQLPELAFNNVIWTFGRPKIDLFTARHNAKYRLYC